MVIIIQDQDGLSKELKEIKLLLASIDSKFDIFIDKLDQFLAGSSVGQLKALDVTELLKLSKPLQDTATTLMELGEATANEVAEKTGLQRAVESAHLNELVRLGYVKKERKGRLAYFSTIK
ncbi:MAG: helix-turn-helix transcriptional regulator [Candidatus Helarchaeota archaeon]|nr:helix-turn-helix transcriptional regulator [Candidatus Helarchaeota archaeon]